jgi:hypothetical protein
MTDLASRMRAVLAILRDEGVADEDVVAVARVGLVLVALVRDPLGPGVRAWMEAQPPAACRLEPGHPFVRYCQRATEGFNYFLILWTDAQAMVPATAVLGTLWAALDRVEGERLAQTLDSWR